MYVCFNYRYEYSPIRTQQMTTHKLLTIADVIDRTSLSRTTIWRLVKAKKFPAPVKIIGTNRKGFVEAEIDGWMHISTGESNDRPGAFRCALVKVCTQWGYAPDSDDLVWIREALAGLHEC